MTSGGVVTGGKQRSGWQKIAVTCVSARKCGGRPEEYLATAIPFSDLRFLVFEYYGDGASRSEWPQCGPPSRSGEAV